MQVAADVGEIDDGRRLAAERLLAQLGRTPRKFERAVDAPLVGRLRKRLERRHIRLRARGTHERRPESLRFGNHKLDRHAVDRYAHRAPLLPFEHSHDLRQVGEPLQRRVRVGRRADHRQQLAGVSPAPHIAGRLAAEGRRDASHELPGVIQQQAAPGPRLALTRQRLEQPSLGLWANSGTARSRPSAAAARSSSAVRTPSARASSTERFALRPR